VNNNLTNSDMCSDKVELLFPMIASVRLVKNLLGEHISRDDQMPPEMANRILTQIFASERHLVGRLPLPFGVSLLATARNPML
ncbi:MAG TPA: hypothetical protein PLD30_16265, partial [Candidatus Competibacteraceae bacterium]|nr:hypothetical protein [Candidatus Competibacteraceae bacterium]